MHALRVFDMRMHVFDASVGCFRHANACLPCQNMALNQKTDIESNTRKTWNRDLYPKTGFLEVRKVRMAGTKMDLPTLVFSSKHMFTYRQSAIKRRTAYSP